MSRLDRLAAWCAHAFATGKVDQLVGPEDAALVDRLAAIVVRRRMVAPAVMLLESSRPLSFLGSQLLHLAQPFATLAFKADEYQRLTRLLETRQAVDLLLNALSAHEGHADE
jgi:hypothetical protein